MSGMVMNHGAEVCESNVVIRVAPAAWRRWDSLDLPKSMGILMAFGMIPTSESDWMTKTGQKAVDLVVQHGAIGLTSRENSDKLKQKPWFPAKTTLKSS